MGWLLHLFCCRESTSAERKIAAILVILVMIIAGIVMVYYGYTAEDAPLGIHIKMGFFMIGLGVFGPIIVRKILDTIFD